MRLSVLVPAYQEERTIAQVLSDVLALDTESHGFEKEVIVCDDGSTDGTALEVQRVCAGDDRVTLVSHERNRGKGAAVRTALEHATGDYVLIQDADLEYDVCDYPAMLAAVRSGADVVYGSRFLTRRWPRGMRAANLVGNRLLTWTANALYGLGITDEATCFKIFRTDLLKSLELECEGFEFCPEVTAKLGLRGVRVAEVPIEYTARNEADGKKVRWTDAVEAFWILFSHRVRRPR